MPHNKDDFWEVLNQAARVRAQPTDLGGPFFSPIKPVQVAPMRHSTSLDLLSALTDVQASSIPLDQALAQRLIPPELAGPIQGLLSSIAARAFNRPRAPAKCVPTLTPLRQLELLRVKTKSAQHPKYAAVLSTMASGSVPLMTDRTWEAWLASTHGRYVRVRPEHGSRHWLSYLLQVGLPQEHLRLCYDFKDLSTSIEVSTLINEAAASIQAPQPLIRTENARFNTCRGKSYLLVALPDEPRSSATGPALSSTGLRAIMLALHMYSKLIHFKGGTSR